ncbi:MAG: endolytic transglycosylase MltG [Clostridia bacterium]|nr:endolytic transglycosylase MltG [Clostridia bacterium]
MKRKILSVCAVVIALIFIFLCTEISGLFRGNEIVSLEISTGASMHQISNQLKDKGVIGSKSLFLLYFRLFGGTYYMGTHEFSSKSYGAITNELETPTKINAVRVTIPEGMEQREIAALLEKKGLVTADEFNSAAKIDNFDYWFLKGIKKRDMELEGYLFPDTYEFSYEEDAKSIITKMLDNFNNKFTDNMKNRATQLGLNVDEVITMASIVEREVASKNELGLVAGVFFNRLDEKRESAGFLQSCATVQYILKERKLVLSISDTKIKSHYNTYLNKGLPIGPIASPGLNCINAALYPEDTDYLYFAADGKGKHYFAKTHDKHLENMKKAGLM